MTQIDFYFHVEDKLRTACALSAKAHAKDLRVHVLCADAEMAHKFDRQLWTQPAISFIPHCASNDKLAAHTPIVIAHDDAPPLHDQVLLNLRDDLPQIFSRFERLIEIVSLDEADRRLARERAKFYKDRGYEVKMHDMSQRTQ